MFFFIGGVQPKTVTLDGRTRSCPRCGHGHVKLQRIDHYLSLFFLPIIPLKKGMPFSTCGNCRLVFDERGDRIGPERESDSRTCLRCGIPLEPDFKYCPYCGENA